MAFDPRDNPLKDVKVQIPKEGVLDRLVEELEEAVQWLSPWQKNRRKQERLRRAGFINQNKYDH